MIVERKSKKKRKYIYSSLRLRYLCPANGKESPLGAVLLSLFLSSFLPVFSFFVNKSIYSYIYFSFSSLPLLFSPIFPSIFIFHLSRPSIFPIFSFVWSYFPRYPLLHLLFFFSSIFLSFTSSPSILGFFSLINFLFFFPFPSHSPYYFTVTPFIFVFPSLIHFNLFSRFFLPPFSSF